MFLEHKERYGGRGDEEEEGGGKVARSPLPPKSPEVAYLETRAIKLMYQQVFMYMHEENLTLFEDSVVTAQAASLFLDFKSVQIGGNKFLVLPADFIQQYAHDIDKCVQILMASSILPFETSEIRDFDNLLLVIGSDNLPENPPTFFIVRNLKQTGGRNPIIHVWKSSESFNNHSMLKGGLTNREIQVQILLRRILSHRSIGNGKSYTIDSLPSHTILVNPNFIDRVSDTQESKQARSLLQNASNFAAKLRGREASADGDKSKKNVKKGNEVHPSDSEFLGASPLMTLMTAFLQYGMDPLQQEPRGSLSKVKSVQEMTLTRQDFCDLVSQMREFLYCLYDSEYFEHGDQKNQTLTQSMLIEQISMSPLRNRSPVKRVHDFDEDITDDEDDEEEGDDGELAHRYYQAAGKAAQRKQGNQRLGQRQERQRRVKRRNSSPSCELSPSHGVSQSVQPQVQPQFNRRVDKLGQELTRGTHKPDLATAEASNNHNFRQHQQPSPRYAVTSRQPSHPVMPLWGNGMIEETQIDVPEVLTARPYQQSTNRLQESPTKELMDRHHDSDALTAYKHQMIQVYKPGEEEYRETDEGTGDGDDDEGVNERDGRNSNRSEKDHQVQSDDPEEYKDSFEPYQVPVQRPLSVFAAYEKRSFLNPKQSLGGMIAPSTQVFEQFIGRKDGRVESRMETEKSSAVFGDGTQEQEPEAPEKRPPMFPDSDDGNDEDDNDPVESVKKEQHSQKAAIATALEKQKKSIGEKVVVPKVKQKKTGTSSKVRRKGDAIIQQIMQNFQKHVTQYDNLSATTDGNNSRRKRSKQPQALRTQLRSRSHHLSDESSGERALVKLYQLAMGKQRKPKSSHQPQTGSATTSKANGRASSKTVGRSKSQKRQTNVEKNAFKQISDQLVGMIDLEAMASFTAGGSHSMRSKLRFKKSPPRDLNAESTIPVLKNQKDQFSTIQPKNGVLVSLQQQLKTDLKNCSASRSVSRGSDVGQGIKSRASSKCNMWDIRMDASSARENVETLQASSANKNSQDKAAAALQTKKAPATNTGGASSKKKTSTSKRGNSKMRLQFIINKDKQLESTDPSLKKRKELIMQELRLSAAKIVIESQEKAKKATKTQNKPPANISRAAEPSLTQQLLKMRQGHLSAQNMILSTQDPTTSTLFTSNEVDNGHAPAVMSPTRITGSQTQLQQSQNALISKTCGKAGSKKSTTAIVGIGSGKQTGSRSHHQVLNKLQ